LLNRQTSSPNESHEESVLKKSSKIFLLSCGVATAMLLAGCQTLASMPQTDPGGKAVVHNEGNAELPEEITPNDATISLYSERRLSFIQRGKERGRLYTIQPKGNAITYQQELTENSQILERELSEGYILSYLYFENGAIRYNGKAKDGRFVSNIDDETLFYSHSTGKSITSYIVGHAICNGYISSMDEVIDWPMMSATLYQGQPLRNLLNMNAGDKHTVDRRSSRVMGSSTHHRDMGLDTSAALLDGTKKIGDEIFYNNVLADVIANYVAFKAGDNYDELMRNIFQEKVKIEHAVSYQKHTATLTDGRRSAYYGQAQTLASYSFYITRMDFLRIAEAMMKDYQNQTCVGKYLKESQTQAKSWPKYRPSGERRHLWLHNYAKKYGAQFYFDFHGMSDRNIMGTEGYNGQNMMIDMDNSRIVVTNSAATAWDQRVFILNVIKDGELPK
jgi:CubicO group peptidase (beta-lactamase class C family)